MARLPGGWNRKHHQSWQVRIARPAGAPVCVDDLRAQFPRAQPSAPNDGSAGDWIELPNGATLAASPRFHALVNANAQLGQLLADAPVGLDCHGYRDDSRSARRAIFVCQLLRARYPDDEIRALATYFTDLLDSGRGMAHFQCDVDRLLAKYTPAGHTAAATRVTAESAGPAPARGGRPITVTAQELLDVYHHYADCDPRGIVLDWTRSEVARQLRVSTDTIQRREGELIAAGTIRREISADRQRSFVILSPATWDVNAQGIATRSAATILPEPCPDVPCPVAAPAAAIPAARTSEPEPAARGGAEDTHHPAAGLETVGESNSADSPPAAGAAPITPGGATAGAGVSVPAHPTRTIMDRLDRPPQRTMRTARPLDAVTSRAPPRSLGDRA
ncbi:MAG: hypothetical protein IPO81_27910 [Kouleothrix sp.]|nr:hypothetical protein [Kouleothrix sp.]